MSRIFSRLKENVFFRHLIALMTGTAIAQAIPVLVSPILTRLYSPEDFGIFALYTAIVSSLVTLACLRYEFVIVMADSEEESKKIMRLSQILSIISCLIFTGLLVLFADKIVYLLKEPQLKYWLYFAGINVFILANIQIYVYWFNRNKAYKAISINKVLQSSILAITQIGLGLIAWFSSMIGLLLGATIGQLAGFVGMSRTFKKSFALEKGILSKREVFPLMRQYSKLPLINGPNAIVDAIRTNGLPVFISLYFSNAMLGQFSLAWQAILAPSALINGALSQLYFQKMSVVPKKDLLSFTLKAILQSALLGLVPFLIIYFASPKLFPVFFGKEWKMAGEIASVLTPWLYLNFITSPLSTFFLIAKKEGVLFLFAVLYMAAPFIIFYNCHSNFLMTMEYISYAMAGLLIGFILLVLIISYSLRKESAVKL